MRRIARSGFDRSKLRGVRSGGGGDRSASTGSRAPTFAFITLWWRSRQRFRRAAARRGGVGRTLCVGLVACVGLLADAGVTASVVSAQGTGQSITATEGAQFSGQVGSVTTSQCVTAPITAGPSGTINWGDGQSSPASYSYVAGTAPHQYTVSGSHTYGEEGSYAATVTTTYTCGPTYTSSFAFAAQVADASLSATATNVTATAGQQFSGQVASFTDADPGGSSSDYAAQIDWGDGSTSAGSIGSGSAGTFTVGGSHTYATAGNYQVTIAVSDAGGASTNAHSSAGVGGAPAPQASFKGPGGSAPVGGLVSLDASGSRTPGANVASFAWSINGHQVAVCDGSTSLLQTRFLHPGVNTVKLGVTDPSGGVTTTQQNLVVSGFAGRGARASSVAFAGRVRTGRFHVISTQQVFTCQRGPSDPVKTIVAPSLHSPGDGCQTQVQAGIISAVGCLTEYFDTVQIKNTNVTSNSGKTFTFSSLPLQPLAGVPDAERVTLLSDIGDKYAKNPFLLICGPGGPKDLQASYCQAPPGDGSKPSGKAASGGASDASALTSAVRSHQLPISQLAPNAVLDTTCSQVASGGGQGGASGTTTFDFSTACLELYVSTGPVAINGLEYVPHNGAVILVAPQFNLVISSDAEIDVGQLQAQAPQAINHMLPSSPQPSDQDVPFLTFPSLAALVKQQPQAQQQFGSVGGFQTAPTSDLQTSFSGQFVTTFTFEVDLPPVFSDGSGGPITAAIHGTISNTGGLQILYGYLGSLSGGGASVDLGPVQLKNFGICYRHQAASSDVPNGGPNDPCPAVTGIKEQAGFGPDFWDASGELDFGGVKLVFRPASKPPIPGCTQAISYGFGFGGDPARLQFAGLALTGITVPVFPGVNFTGISAGFKQGATPATEIVAGCILFNVYKFVDVTGNVFAAFGPYQFTGGELGPNILQPSGIPSSFPRSNDFALGASGVVSLTLPDPIGTFQVGGGYALYINSPPSVFFGAGFDFSVPVGGTYSNPPDTGIAIAGGLAGGVGLQSFPPPFYIEGYLHAKGVVGAFGAEFTVFDGSLIGIFSDQPKTGTGGIALCGTVSVFDNSATLTAGLGYHWGDSIGDLVTKDFHTGGDCNTNDPTSWLAPFFVNVQASSAQAHSAQARTTVIHVPRGAKAADLYLGSPDSAPDVTVTGPGGVSVSSAGAPIGRATVHDSILLARVTANHQTYITLMHPVAGTYRITLNAGSPPITQIRQEIAVTPSVKAHVTGRGIHRHLVYRIKPEPGQMVTFVESSPEEGLHVLASRSGGRGSIAFTAVPGLKRRQIIAEITENASPAVNIPVASYAAPSRLRLARVRRVRLSRSGANATISFTPVRGATFYSVYVAFDNGERRFFSTTARRLRIGGISAEITALVTVQAIGDKVYTLPSAPRSAKLGAAYRFHRVVRRAVRRKHH